MEESGEAKSTKGKAADGRRASGRRYCTSVVGTNWRPKKVPPFWARKCWRTGSTRLMPWLSNGTENRLRNLIQLTAA